MNFQAGTIHWNATRFGQGSQWLIALHGYGQNASLFRHFAEHYGDRYSILAIDLAHHGSNTDIPPTLLFDDAYARIWLEAILEKTGMQRIGMLGFSIGGRISMSLASWFPDQISELILLAPDGLPVSLTYRFLTRTWLGNVIFRRFILYPGVALGIIKAGVACGWMPGKVADYFKNEISTLVKRQQLFDTWMTYRNALPKKQRLRLALKNKKIPVTCVLGKNDKVIPFKKTRKTALERLSGMQLVELEIGHNLLSDKAMKLLSANWRQ